MPDKAPWITYRPQLKVLDCTIRDGGLVNDSQFTDEFVRAVYEACLEAGIDYMEIGYKNSPALFPPGQFGSWRHCREEDVRRVVGKHDSQATGLKLSVMADAGGKSDWKVQIEPKDKSVIDMVRVACYVNQIPEAVAMIEHAHRMGYETTCNIMAVSTAQDVEIDQALEVLRARYPELGEQLLTPDGLLHPAVNLFVGEEDVRGLQGLQTPLQPGQELTILPALSGG